MDPEAAALRLQRLSEARRRTGRDDAMSATFQLAARDLRRLEKGLAGVAEAWEAVCPAELLSRTAIRSLSRGKLTIAVADASTQFTLDRHLRSGGERELARGCPVTVRSVRLVQDASIAPQDGA